MSTASETKSEKDLYRDQNRAIHSARAQLCMDLDDCRELAREIGGKPSLSSLTLKQRWELIEILKSKGARVKNPYLPESLFRAGSNHHSPMRKAGKAAPPQSGCSLHGQENPKALYPDRLAYWNNRFPRQRPGYATNRELAWVETMFILDFNDGRAGTINRGLRGFIKRQTAGLEDGPVSDLAFLKAHHVQAVLSPLKVKAREKIQGGSK